MKIARANRRYNCGCGGGEVWMEVPPEASVHHGKKRHADEDLVHEQRLSKRFNLLNLENNGKLYLPVKQATAEPPPHVNGDDAWMQLDETKEKVYIYNLDQELADIESEEERLVFLPDIEKKLGRIPKSLLRGHSQPAVNTQMVLYNVPSSLTIAPEQDNVRKAIIETRARAREKQLEDARASKANNDDISKLANGVQHDQYCNGLNGTGNIEDYGSDDENAMDIG